MDFNGHVTTSLYDRRGDLLSQQDPLGACTSFGYDGVGNQILCTDARGLITIDTLFKV